MLSTDIYAKTAVQGVISGSGETVLSDYIGASDVKAIITTHIVDIGKASAPVPEERNSNCTYSRIPCSVVDKIKIFVDGKNIDVPRSVFADLADLNGGQFKKTKQGMMLTFTGGDAAAAYNLEILFDKKRVLRRKVENAEFPNNTWEETVYTVKAFAPNM